MRPVPAPRMRGAAGACMHAPDPYIATVSVPSSSEIATSSV